MARKKVEGVLPARSLTAQSIEVEYYQVEVGVMGVVLPAELDLETMSGLKLVRGEASVIESKELAEKVAEMVDGKVVTVTEEYSASRSYEDGTEQRARRAYVALSQFTKRVNKG